MNSEEMIGWAIVQYVGGAWIMIHSVPYRKIADARSDLAELEMWDELTGTFRLLAITQILAESATIKAAG